MLGAGVDGVNGSLAALNSNCELPPKFGTNEAKNNDPEVWWKRRAPLDRFRMSCLGVFVGTIVSNGLHLVQNSTDCGSGVSISEGTSCVRSSTRVFTSPFLEVFLAPWSNLLLRPEAVIKPASSAITRTAARGVPLHHAELGVAGGKEIARRGAIYPSSHLTDDSVSYNKRARDIFFIQEVAPQAPFFDGRPAVAVADDLALERLDDHIPMICRKFSYCQPAGRPPAWI